MDVVDTASRIVMIGQTVVKKLPFEMEKIIVKGLTIRGSAGSPNVFPQTIDLLSKKKADISKIISHTYSLEKAKEDFRPRHPEKRQHKDRSHDLRNRHL